MVGAGVRQEQDIYVRLIDSVTKQVEQCTGEASPTLTAIVTTGAVLVTSPAS